MNPTNRALIIGATSAIAESCCRKLIGEGASLVCIGRDANKLESLKQDLLVRATGEQQVHCITADLTDTEAHHALLQEAHTLLPDIDSVLIAHGSLPDQKACEQSYNETAKQININALSVISLLTELANDFEKKGKGVIAVITSVAGDRGRQSNYVYGAAKGMVSTFLQGLRNRLSKSAVSVVDIKPGFVDTPMTASFDKSGPLWAQPEQVAEGIIQAMKKGKDEVYLLWFWRWIMLIIKLIPERIFKKLSL
ncbi:SDR family oxidoreductase [Alteromonas sp. a30]|uniref:SDR family oxidoreductase n=1 Tax=Alteromonas sp. a30 TaxID=2730917 RepID=UPI00227E5DCB|nr:SDR family oxidoreductase [Alteromonas sp. a30]MCY7295032.1 SDR family oxidoreductase [Alteromonas sp. a30]